MVRGEFVTELFLQTVKLSFGIGVSGAIRQEVQVITCIFAMRREVHFPQIGEDMVCRVDSGVRGLQSPVDNFLMGGGGEIFGLRLRREVGLGHGLSQGLPQAVLDRLPLIIIPVFLPPRLEDIFRRYGIGVFLVPVGYQLRFFAIEMGPKFCHFGGGNLVRDRLPAVSVTEEHDKVGPGREPLAAGDLGEADIHGLLLPLGFFIHPPAQIHRLERRASRLAIFLQVREDLLLKNPPLRPHVGEGRADKNPEGILG